MRDDKRLIFHIDAYTPETIPMAKLAEYMADFAALLGKENAVHFSELQPGSTKIAARVEFEDLPKVQTRLNEIRRGEPTGDMAKIFGKIDTALANDNANGIIYLEGETPGEAAELLQFPGRDRPKSMVWGPITQEGSLDGLLIAIGGRDETVPVRLQNGEIVYTNCSTTRPIARELAHHLYEPIRVFGSGKWQRETDGSWALLRFKVVRFEVLEKVGLLEAVKTLRAVRSDLDSLDDPLGDVADLRRDEDSLH